jgi:ubiquinone/menaquinone biosynthesis C-methylase UbiE
MFMVSAAKGTPQQEQAGLISRYWDGFAPEFAVSCIEGLASSKAEAYMDIMRKHLPQGKILKVLDIGTGTGFMAFVLAEEGHEVTGIDFSPIMLEEAEYIKNRTGIKVDFQISQADLLPFEDETFDLAVSRNNTWLMQEPEKAFAEWRRVLKKEGVLVYFDANWYNYLFHHDEKERFMRIRSQARKKGYTTLYGMGHSSSAIMDEIAKELPMSKVIRPQWDKDNLNAFGFSIEHIIDDVSSLVYTEEERFVNADIPLFMVKARKTSDEAQA